MLRHRRLLAAIGLVILSLAVFLALRRNGRAGGYVTVAVDRADIADVVGATGTLQAVTTVQVGSQVSGTIQSLGADFNSTVKKGQVIARLDPSLFEARVGQAKANLVSARANVERSRATVEDGRQKYERAKELAAQNLVPQSDLESAKATHEGAVAQLKASEAAVSQADANLNQADVDLAHTVITAPIDGVVIARNVDVGQTVAASFQAPVLFVIANDLTRMQVNASIDEADIGRVRAGQDVSFRVDAYPDETFTGKVEQVRLQPITNQNVVTYNTIISVENKGQRLMPGMTATVSLVIRKRDHALRIPAAALRFRPEGFEERMRQRGDSGGGPRGPSADGPGGMRGSGGPWPGSGGGGRANRGMGGWFSGGSGGAEGRPGLVFVLGADARPQPQRVRLGISDGRFVEVVEGLEEGAKVVTGMEESGGRPRPSAQPSMNPFAPGPPRPRQR